MCTIELRLQNGYLICAPVRHRYYLSHKDPLQATSKLEVLQDLRPAEPLRLVISCLQGGFLSTRLGDKQ